MRTRNSLSSTIGGSTLVLGLFLPNVKFLYSFARPTHQVIMACISKGLLYDHRNICSCTLLKIFEATNLDCTIYNRI